MLTKKKQNVLKRVVFQLSDETPCIATLNTSGEIIVAIVGQNKEILLKDLLVEEEKRERLTALLTKDENL